VTQWFDGAHPEYLSNDTSYHDIDHTLQVSLCWSRLMINRALIGETPAIPFPLFRLGLIAVLFHDIGYLKRAGDLEGTGAKYTHIHEERGCEFVAKELPAFGFSAQEIASIQRFIRCTGPRAVISAIPFPNEAERVVGMAVCTADYLGQMSDPHYVAKLPGLFREFQENDEFRGLLARPRHPPPRQPVRPTLPLARRPHPQGRQPLLGTRPGQHREDRKTVGLTGAQHRKPQIPISKHQKSFHNGLIEI
jgi:hypothetical protein